MKNLNPVCWFDIHVSNLERSKIFYQKVLHTELTDLPLEWGKQSAFPFEEQGTNATGALVEKPDLAAKENSTVIYFSSVDCITEQDRVVEAGGKIIQEKTAIGEFGFISMFQDLDGNTIGLHSRQ